MLEDLPPCLPARTAYDLAAPHYAAREWCAIWAELEWPLIASWLRRAATGPLLDAGCGPGLLAASIRAEGFDPICLDLSEKMAANAARTALAVCGDLLALPFQPETFAAVLCLRAICHTPSKVAALAEARRVLRPGGCLVVSDVDAAAGSWTRLDTGHGREVRAWTERLDPTAVAVLAKTAGLEIADTARVLSRDVWSRRRVVRPGIDPETPFLHLFLLTPAA